jgi:hypothetical protein
MGTANESWDIRDHCWAQLFSSIRAPTWACNIVNGWFACFGWESLSIQINVDFRDREFASRHNSQLLIRVLDFQVGLHVEMHLNLNLSSCSCITIIFSISVGCCMIRKIWLPRLRSISDGLAVQLSPSESRRWFWKSFRFVGTSGESPIWSGNWTRQKAEGRRQKPKNMETHREWNDSVRPETIMTSKYFVDKFTIEVWSRTILWFHISLLFHDQKFRVHLEISRISQNRWEIHSSHWMNDSSLC